MAELRKWGWPAVLVVAMVSACGGDSSAASVGNQGAGAPAPVSLKEVFDKLEALGKLPVIDRSDSIAGPDANANGVREDIERHIESRADTPAQKNSLKSLSRALSGTMTVDTKDPNALRGVTNSINTAVGCEIAP